MINDTKAQSDLTRVPNTVHETTKEFYYSVDLAKEVKYEAEAAV